MPRISGIAQSAGSIAFLACLLYSVPSAKGGDRRHKLRSDRGIETEGDYIQMAIPLSALAYSLMIGDYEGASQWGKSVGATIAATEILKYSKNEERPYQAEDDPKGGRTFPSGHTSFAFAGAGYWQHRYGWRIGVPMYAAAPFVGYSRVYSYKHNWADVFAGAAIGIGFSYMFAGEYMPYGAAASLSPVDGGARLDVRAKF